MNVIGRAKLSDCSGRNTSRAKSVLSCSVFGPSLPDRVVAIAALSSKVPGDLISKILAQTLHRETGERVLLINLAPGPEKLSLKQWTQISTQINGDFGLDRYLQTLGSNVRKLSVHVAATSLEAGRFLCLIDHCKQHFHYVIVHVGVDVPMPLLLDCLHQSDRTFLLLQPTSRDIYHRDMLLHEVRSRLGFEGARLKTIICRERGEEQCNELLKAKGGALHGFVHGCPPFGLLENLNEWSDQQFLGDIRRIAREIGHCRVGLALSSGGARGLSHIGVIQVLEENGIKIDAIAGCSMGSYVGAVWAYGYDGMFMEKLAREVEHRWGIFELVDPFILPRQGFLRGEKVKQRLKRSIGDVHFSELARPLRVVATNLFTLERVVFSSGEVAQAVHASSAIPGACAPVNINGELFIDGGVCDPLPVDVLEEMGIEKIIAVNTIPTPAFLKCGEERERERREGKTQNLAQFRSFLSKHLNYFSSGNILDTIFRSFHGAQIRVAEQSCERADLVLRPLCMDARWHDFRRPGKYIAIGRREAERHIEEIKSLLSRKEPINEIKLADNTLATSV